MPLRLGKNRAKTIPQNAQNSPRTFLFAHKACPGQFGGIAKHLSDLGHNVHFLTHDEHFADPSATPKVEWAAIHYVEIEPQETTHHRYLDGVNSAVEAAHAYQNTALKLRDNGIEIDLICTHSGWGCGSFLPTVWPKATVVQYLEWWYTFPARDVPDASTLTQPDQRAAYAKCRNLSLLLDAQSSDLVIVPTAFQAADMPQMIRDKTKIIHDGVDLNYFKPGQPKEWTRQNLGIPDDAPIVTYATRGMEPTRGFQHFMAALSILQRRDPNVHCVVAGEDSVHYGKHPPKGNSWKEFALSQNIFDTSRLHFVGQLPLAQYRDLLRSATVHVYLTEPFILSWSLIHAMGIGCPMVVSDNDAVREALPKQGMARHIDHHDIPKLAINIFDLLTKDHRRKKFSENARKQAQKQYDAGKIHAEKTKIFMDLINKKRPGG